MIKKILIIEDDKVLNEMYGLKFLKEWYKVESAYDWIEWLSKITSFNPDVILLDIMMPSMNWFETLEALKNQTSSNCKIIIFTNIVDKDKIDKAMKMWADDYLIKANITPKDVLEKVELHIEKLIEDKIIYINSWLNLFKIKNPNGWKDIEVEINIKL